MTKRITPIALGLAIALSANTSVAADKPYAPSNLTVNTMDEISVDDWNDPKRCRSCHPKQFKGWQGSMHSIAFIDPVYQAEWALGEKETQGATRNLCSSCHSIPGTAAQKISFDPSKGKHGGFDTEGVAQKGVSCDVCHTVSATNILHTSVLEHGNASVEVTPGKVKRGPLSDAKSPMHNTEYSELHTKSEFCGSCHNVFHPGNDFPIERTFDEWKYSPYAQNNIQCQDCHMVPVEVAIRVADEMKPARDLENHGQGGQAARRGPERALVHNHAFVGGNAVIAPLLGVDGGEAHRDEAVKRLQSAASVDTKVERTQGDLHTITVTVHNNRAGHALPTSLTFIRQLWLEVVVRDESGNELLRSGSIDADNALPKGTVIFQNKAVDGDGHGPQHKPWKVYSFSEQNTIPAKGSRDATYAVNLPQGVGYSVETHLNYRSFSQGAADLLVGEEVRVPYVEMAASVNHYDSKGKLIRTEAPRKAGVQAGK